MTDEEIIAAVRPSVIELTSYDSLLDLADLPRQFDAIIHIDETRALEPLERWPLEHTHEAPETYPSAL